MRLLLFLLYLSLCTPAWSQAVWRGRTYNSRVCSSPNCRMCASIQAQLNTQTYRRAPSPVVVSQPQSLISTKPVVPAFAPTPYEAVNTMLRVSKLQEGEHLYDLGCGDGRILLAATRDYKAKAVGVEIDSGQASRALENIEGREAVIILGDATKHSLSHADVVTVYLYPEVLEQIRWDTMKAGTRVVSYIHEVPNLNNGKKITEGDHVFYIYRVD